MAGVELAGQMAILEEALKRLEGELARDAAWRALQARDGLDDDAHTRLTEALEANPVYLAWRNMREAAAMLQQRDGPSAVPEASPEAAPAQDPTRVAMTLAEALQQLPPEESEAEDVPGDVAQLLAAQVAAQLTPQAPAPAEPETPVRLTPEEREQFEVGTRATQAVERILAIPVIEPIAPRSTAAKPAPPPLADPAPTAPRAPPAISAAPAAPASEPTDDIGHSVPLEAEDLAFLLTPAARVPAGDQSPFLKRLVAEAQSLPTKATLVPPADPFMVPPASPPAAPEATAPSPAPEAPPESTEGAGRKPRLARLLKAWSRH